MNKLTRLVYVSRVSDAARLDLASTVGAVLKVSRANNAKAGVTGMLLTHDGFFLQTLEGPDHAVQATWARVSHDARHSSVKVIGTDFCTARAFGRWAMCANDLSAADTDILRVLAGRGQFQPYEMTAPSAVRLLKTIADIHTRQAEAAA
ncbi:BLUF domain-containing protein [Caulobacter sp. S45]|uniref:BLUF domain-containing protein n=1 Tax=Caulobacter sp. S45 TaxID=1641861 RepID=UPI0015761A0D|nr:BLUF domain-containing protein [Caulobacter sp. S45]